MKKKLDFIIVGAQKAGTTSLAAYLGESDQIFIPSEKEVPYFVEERMRQRGWDWYLETYFSNAGPDRLWGTSSPQYMMYPDSFGAIKNKLPDVKIIVTLRDPIERLLSHFDMATRFGVENRKLSQVVEEQLDKVGHYRQTPYLDRTGKYLVSGEYGRILMELLGHFDRQQVLIIDFEDIRKDAQLVVDRLSDFLGITRFSPGNLHAVRMRGGGRRRIDVDHDRIIATLGRSVKSLGLAGLVPVSLKLAVGRLSSRLDEFNVDPSVKSGIDDLPPELLDRLQEFYRMDAIRLRQLDINGPWLERWNVAPVDVG